MKTAIWTEHFADLDVEDAIETIASIGYDAVAITPWFHDGLEPTMSAGTIDRITGAADRHGIEVAGLARVFGPDHDFLVTSPDGAERERARSFLEASIELCSALDGSVIPFGASRQRRCLDDVSYGAAWEYALDVFGHPSLLQQLEDHEVRIGVEPLSKSASNFINTTPEAVRFVEDIDHPNVGVTIDGYHLVDEPGTIPELIAECQEHLVEFHADDPTGFGPGSGDQDYTEIHGALESVGFDGYVTVEFHSFLGDAVPDDDPRELADRSFNYLRSCWSG